MDSKEISEIGVIQTLWHDLMLQVLHDTSSHLRLAHKDNDRSYRISERTFELIYARIHSDRELLMYLGYSAKTIPQHYMRGRELFNAIEQVMSFGGHGWYFGYSIYDDSETVNELIACPGFTLNAILACMLFRIPSGTSDDPTELVHSLSVNLPNRSNVSIKIQTRLPPTTRNVEHIQIDDQGRWDPWHHSWNVAYVYAKKYQGECSAFITPEKQMAVTLDLPVLQ